MNAYNALADWEKVEKENQIMKPITADSFFLCIRYRCKHPNTSNKYYFSWFNTIEAASWFFKYEELSYAIALKADEDMSKFYTKLYDDVFYEIITDEYTEDVKKYASGIALWQKTDSILFSGENKKSVLNECIDIFNSDFAENLNGNPEITLCCGIEDLCDYFLESFKEHPLYKPDGFKRILSRDNFDENNVKNLIYSYER